MSISERYSSRYPRLTREAVTLLAFLFAMTLVAGPLRIFAAEPYTHAMVQTVLFALLTLVFIIKVFVIDRSKFAGYFIFLLFLLASVYFSWQVVLARKAMEVLV